MSAAQQGDYQVIHRAPVYAQWRELAQQRPWSSFVDVRDTASRDYGLRTSRADGL